MPPDSTNNAAEAEPVLEIRNLFTHFESDEGVVKAVDGVTFTPGCPAPARKTICVGSRRCWRPIAYHRAGRRKSSRIWAVA